MIDKSIRDAEAESLRKIFEFKKGLEKRNGRLLTQKMVGEKIGWTQPNVSAYLKGSVELREDAAIAFAKAFDVPVSAFSPRIASKILEREVMARNPLGTTKVTYVPKLNADILNKVRKDLRDKSFIMPMSEETIPVPASLPSNAFAYELKDQSLSEKVPEGTIFVIDPLLAPKPTNFVLVGNKARNDDYHVREYCVLEVMPNGDERYLLKSHNPAYPDLKENYEILGVAVCSINMLLT